MKSKTNKSFLIFSVFYYAVFIALMIFGTFKDVNVDIALFDPSNSFAKWAESFGQFVYWGMWGPAFTVIILCKHKFSEIYDVCKLYSKSVVKIKDPNEKTMAMLDKIFTVAYSVVFFVLSVIGWKKLVQNVTKNILADMGKENLSEAVYFAISAVVAAVALLIFSRINSETLRKLEKGAFIGIVMGIFCKLVEELKPITERVRFREMVAYSNNYLNDKGMSEGKYSPLTSEMTKNTDFSAFTPWYKKGDAMGIYSRSDSFPSGHTCYSCTSFLTYVFFNTFEKLKKFAPVALVFGFLYVGGMAVARMIAGAHYLTDVAAAALIGYTVFVLVKCLYEFLASKKIVP